MSDLLTELKSTVLDQGPDGFEDIQNEVKQAAKSVKDDQKDCSRVTLSIFRILEMLERAEDRSIGFSCQIRKVQECLGDDKN